MKSMTGYGRGEASSGGLKATVEISSVNRKQAEFAFSLPSALEGLEPRLREEVAAKVSRGRVNIRVVCQESSDAGAVSVKINRELARAYAAEFASLARELGLESGVTLDQLLRVPGVLHPSEDPEAPERWFPVIVDAIRKALEAMVGMREKEGRHLSADLAGRVSAMRAASERVRTLAPRVLERYREQLRERVKNAGLEMPAPDDDRLLKEVVLFADRSDISEELARLESHFGQFDDCVKSEIPVGRTLDFLAQEIHREINTIGSKANDGVISREVVTLKTEIEKFREQAQNVE